MFIRHLTGKSSPPPRGVRGIRSARWRKNESQMSIGSGRQDMESFGSNTSHEEKSGFLFRGRRAFSLRSFAWGMRENTH